jgi:RNA polymerase sigma-70 factor (ECF subfamily)
MVVETRKADIDELWGRLRSQLLGYVAARTRSRQDAEDIVQDVFLRMHLALERGDAIERLDGWMFAIARNALIDAHRRTRPAPEVAEPSARDDEELRSTLARCVTPFVERLPAPYADAVRWTDVEGLSQADAAKRAGLSLSGMKSRVQRGRQRLRALLDECCRFEIDCRGKVFEFASKNDDGCSGC